MAMLRSIPPPSTLSLLECLVPSLVCRARAFSITTIPKAAKPVLVPVNPYSDAPGHHSKIREQIMGHTHWRHIPDALKEIHNTSVAEIKKALDTGNLTAALKHWQSLREQKAAEVDDELYRLPEQVERQISTLFVSRFTTYYAGWSEDIQSISRNFALQAAAMLDITDALHTLLLYFVQQKEPQTAVDLYHTYQQILAKNTAERDSPLELDDKPFHSEDEGDEHFNSGRSALLFVAIAAHAMNDSFQGALSAFQMANIRPPSYRQKMLQSLPNDHILNQKIQNYLHRIHTAFIVSRPTSLSKHIMNIAHPKSATLLEQLYRDILNGISGSDAYLALDISRISPTQPIAMTEVGWTAFQTGFIRCERTDMAAQMWTDLADRGFTPGVAMWTALLDTHANLRDSKKAMTTWNSMLEHGIKPDTLAYRAIISALFDDNHPAEALNRFREYHKTIRDTSDQALTVYNTVLRGLLRVNRIADANTLLSVMKSKGPKPDRISFNTFLGYYSRQKNFKDLSEVVAQMSNANIAGDVVTFSTILTALLNAGRKEAIGTILNLMRKQGIQPNVATYTAIIDHQLREGTMESLTGALSVLEKMEQDPSTRPNEITYTSILASLYRTRNVPRERVAQVRADIVAKMRRGNISFRPPTYHILIRAAMDSSDPNGYLDALALLQEMETQGLPVTNTAWYLTFAGLMHRGLWDVAKDLVEKMLSSGYETTPRLDKLINDIQNH